MLSDHERAALRKVERQILAEDPQFVRTFDTRAQQLPGGPRRPLNQDQRTYTVLMWVAAALSLLMAVAGSPGGALLFAVVAVTFALACRRGGTTTPRT